MTAGTVLLEVTLSGFQILRGRGRRVPMRVSIVMDPLRRNVTRQSVFYLPGFAERAPVHRGQSEKYREQNRRHRDGDKYQNIEQCTFHAS